jgi:hypothetical protein
MSNKSKNDFFSLYTRRYARCFQKKLPGLLAFTQTLKQNSIEPRVYRREILIDTKGEINHCSNHGY